MRKPQKQHNWQLSAIGSTTTTDSVYKVSRKHLSKHNREYSTLYRMSHKNNSSKNCNTATTTKVACIFMQFLQLLSCKFPHLLTIETFSNPWPQTPKTAKIWPFFGLRKFSSDNFIQIAGCVQQKCINRKSTQWEITEFDPQQNQDSIHRRFCNGMWSWFGWGSYSVKIQLQVAYKQIRLHHFMTFIVIL